MKKIIFTLTMALLANCLQAQNNAGNWYGALHIQGKQLRIVFHISETGDHYETTMDSPDQGASGLHTDNTTVTGNHLVISAASMGITYSGDLVSDSNKINGTFAQGSHSLPMTLSTTEIKVTKAKHDPRPQDPTDFPYKQEEVTFLNTKGGNTLAGTLTMPTNGKATKIVVMITGSGPQNRDEEVEKFNHRPFLVWSDWLTRQGIAVLRYDDRGMGASTGIFGTSTSADFADDAAAAVSYIKSRTDLKNLSIGLIGHSEGGMIAPIVASSDPAVKFIVLLAGPGAPIADLMIDQTRDQMRLSGAPDSAIATALALNKILFAAIKENKDLTDAELKTKLTAILRTEIGKMPEANLNGQSIDETINTSLAGVMTPWFRYFITFDPATYLTRTKCPVLAINGTLDMQVSCEPNLKAIKENLQKAGNNNVQVVPLEGLNHLFQKATTGAVAEYGQITETVNPIAMKTVTNWINKL